MRITKLLTLAATILLTTHSNAEDEISSFSYDVLDFQYFHVAAAESEFDLVGMAIGGSFSIAKNLFIEAAYSSSATDPNFVDPEDPFSLVSIEIRHTSIGIGFHAPIESLERTDYVMRAARNFINAKFSESDSSEESIGTEFDAGLRTAISDQFEGECWLAYTELERDSDTAINITARFKVSHSVALTAKTVIPDQADDFYGVGVEFFYR